MNARAPLVLISAGGTGGHLFPAEALAHVLRRLGLRVVLVTDERVGALAERFPAEEVVSVPSATPSRRSVLGMVEAAGQLWRGVLASRALIKRLEPAIVVGFGGYPTVPPLFAAWSLGTKRAIHEQNGVVGRANRFLASRVDMIATGFPEVRGLPRGVRAAIVHTGNPVRQAVIEAAKTLYPAAHKGAKLRLLVFGGSQGAKVMSDVVPEAVAKLPPEYLERLVVTQQAREEDMARVLSTYRAIEAQAEVRPFFADLPQRIADAHLVVARSGASTVAELAAIGRPSILVPLPGALDQDQAANARTLHDVGAALMLPQTDFTPERLCAELVARFENPERLTEAALKAKAAGAVDAAERLAAAILGLAGIDPARYASQATA
ncbi:undecaprenyldiphospho-muramoylpentapeptide beta-N-acetylglucosaminyltransferase [Salinarimonas ramus]|uniref:UDP-N-acetylglucosamine--N-acetylmuramyl-(pentapeptide) pyrophosphoryl-undecaprenol N-acetylglucosamine transferase n=1 Tax=Salinarimonas ramus TaxID=690164 RepID=A0A917QD40_9HYPH|nr:undecaprenyldiphospho-muramoylpentapeptide beta-N-acetylglucosaminyltransferase [Salinarimonas ramus]GGK45344.1 UDP-N-acetylglucosamine--N-acetylmuramyl-(pentapeptide) pyrophosphoryl-undecaprenol N-acetylglucosamine transferase [Salinarimonas ramus]